MLDGIPDPVKERWDNAVQMLKMVRAEVDGALNRLAEARAQREN